MKKAFFLLLCSALPALATVAVGQKAGYYPKAVGHQYPLAVNEQKTSVLVFPAPIATHGIDLGSADILAATVPDVPNVLKVKAAAKDILETNLTVITTDGRIFSFGVYYSEYPDDKPIDLGKQLQEESAVALFRNRKLNDEQVKQLSRQIGARKAFMHHPKAKSFGIKVRLTGIYVVKDVLFYTVEVHNKSHIDYALDFTRFFIRDSKRIKRTATQEKEIKPLYIYQQHGALTAGKTRQILVFAFPRFTIADRKEFVLQLFEKNGDRNVSLKVNGDEIAKARSISFTP